MNHENCKVLVTGAAGFVGTAVVKRLVTAGASVRCAVRKLPVHFSDLCAEVIQVGDIAANTDWRAALAGIDVVVHAAARVHIMPQSGVPESEQYQAVNVDGTMALARQAVEAGVKRFVFISSAKVNGESTEGRRPFHADESPAPEDAYALSKHQAEQALLTLAGSSVMQVVIVRPPLVYGPGVKANFQKMIRMALSGFPMPFGLAKNKRSLVFVENLAAFVELCVRHPAAANQIFMVSDDRDFSVREMLEIIGTGAGRKPLLLPVPLAIFKLIFLVTRKTGYFERIFGTLLVDKDKTRSLLGWTAPYDAETALALTSRSFCHVSNQIHANEKRVVRVFRLLDIFIAVIGLLLAFPFMLLIWIVGLFDTGSPIFIQTRMGKGQAPFNLVKFRTMSVQTESKASHLVSASSITRFGHILRRTKLDELPQLWNVLLGHMSIVGPRPCLPNQTELIAARERLGVFRVRPGITGLGQLSGVDMSTPEFLAEIDAKMIERYSLRMYFQYIVLTALGKGAGDAVKR